MFSRAVLMARKLYAARSGKHKRRRGSRALRSVLLPYDVMTSGETYGDYSAEVHLFPFRTEKLSPAAPMILH